MVNTENKVQISVRKNPFALGHIDHVLPAGISISQMLDEVGLLAITEVHSGLFVYVNDELIERARWDSTKLVHGSIVAVAVTPSGSGQSGGKDPARTMAMIAVMAVAIIASSGAAAAVAPSFVAGSMAPGLIGAFAGAAISVAGSMLVNALIPIPSQKSNGNDSPNYLSGMSNTLNPYGPIPRLFGKHRIYPKYAAVPYTELVGTDEQYLRALFIIGKGKYKLSEFKIGDTDIADMQGVEMEKYYTGTTTSYKLFPNDVAETALSIELQYNVAQTRTTGENVDEITLEVTFPSGLYRISSGGERKLSTCEIKTEYSVKDANQWRTFNEFFRLDFSGYPANEIDSGQTITSATGSGTIRYAHHAMTWNDSGLDDSDGHDIIEMIYYVDYVDIEVSSGSFSIGQTTTINGSYTAVIASAVMASNTISGEYGSAFKKSFTQKVPRGQYDVRVTRMTADASNEFRTVYLTSLRTLTYQTPFTLTGCTLLALRIKASGQLNGMIDQFNCLAESLLNVYDGSTWNLVKTRNPAWAYVEVLCGSSNKRPVSLSRLNLASIRAFAARCDTAGFYFDAIVDYNTTVWELSRQICAAGRATPGMTDNAYTVIEDIVRSTPIQQFSPRNSWGFSGSRMFPDVPHALRIRFINSAKNYDQDECIVYDDGYNSGNAQLFETLEFFGVTTYNHCWRLGRYHLACLRLRPETYTFNVDIEHMVCTRGDRVRITHDVLMVGIGQARVTSISTTEITIDDVFPMENGKTYAFQFRRSDGTFKTATIVTIPGDNPANTVYDFSPAMDPSDIPGVGDLSFFGESGSVAINVLVSRIDPGPDLSARLTCIPYNTDILDADAGTIPAWDSNITLPPVVKRTPPKPKIISATIIYRAPEINSYGTYQLVMVVGFDAQSTAFVATSSATDPFQQRPDVTQGFQAQYQEDSGNWVTLDPIDSTARKFEFPAKNDTAYIIRLRSYSTPGAYSSWDTYNYGTTDFEDALPDNVSGLSLVNGVTWDTKDLEVKWTQIAGGGTGGSLIKDYKVEVLTSNGLTSLRTEYVTQNKYIYNFDKNIGDGGPRPAIRIKVQARNMFGLLSQTPADVTFTNVSPSAVQGLGGRPFMGGVEFYWTPAVDIDDLQRFTIEDVARLTRDDEERYSIGGVESDIIITDFAYYLYRIKIGSGVWSGWTKTLANTIVYTLSEIDKDTYGADATIYFEVKIVDAFLQESSALAIDRICGSLNIKETDIDDFAVSASKIFTKIPIIQGLSVSNNTPSSGYITWNACSLVYNGITYQIPTGNTNLKYIYWKDMVNAFLDSDTHPAGLSDWKSGEDFIILVNINGTAQEAWNAIANEVIGSAYIQTAGIQDANIANLSGTKIITTSSIAIGSATWTGNGIQLEYNSGSPRFYAGNGVNDFVKFNENGLTISSGVGANAAININAGIIGVKSTLFGSQGIQLDYNAGSPRFYAGDGGLNYIKFDGSKLLISTDQTNALQIKNGGDILVEYGGSLKFRDATPAQIFRIECDSLNSAMMIPATNNTKSMKIGDSSHLWDQIWGYASRSIVLQVYQTSYGYGDFRVDCGAQYGGYVSMACSDTVHNKTAALMFLILPISTVYKACFVPTVEGYSSVLYDIGTSAGHFDQGYAHNWNSLGDFLYLDSRNDLEIFRQIKNSKKIDSHTGLSIIDDDSLPDILVHKIDGKRQYNSQGKPWINNTTFMSLLMGAIRQIDRKIKEYEDFFVKVDNRIRMIEKREPNNGEIDEFTNGVEPDEPAGPGDGGSRSPSADHR